MNNTTIPTAQTITENGVQYVLVGNCRFKVTEHFPTHGKTYDTLLTDVIQRAGRSVPAIIKESIEKSS